jgi:NAD(P)-dependent dehydrogenase (short-subunit alcohol dehydrogenase family)
MTTPVPPTKPLDRWVLLSGASSGIGRAIAIELVGRGFKVVLIGRREAQLAETARLTQQEDRTLVLPLDLARLDEIVPRITELAKGLGRLYGVCHCAGAAQTLPLSASTPERVQAQMNLNFGAGLELCRAVTRRGVLEEQGGSIVWIGSIYSHVGAPGQTAYAASKGAITAAMRCLALELAPRKVRVNCISPGMVRTAMTDASRSRLSEEQWKQIEAMHPLGAGQPEDVARAAAFLLDPENKWMTGTDLVLDGGYSLH